VVLFLRLVEAWSMTNAGETNQRLKKRKTRSPRKTSATCYKSSASTKARKPSPLLASSMVALTQVSSLHSLQSNSTPKSKSAHFKRHSLCPARFSLFYLTRNLADRLMTPFPTTSTVLPPGAPLKDHEEYTKQLMY
jgi:hypothetical protein